MRNLPLAGRPGLFTSNPDCVISLNGGTEYGSDFLPRWDQIMQWVCTKERMCTMTEARDHLKQSGDLLSVTMRHTYVNYKPTTKSKEVRIRRGGRILIDLMGVSKIQNKAGELIYERKN